ncbi:unnamed protein product [Ilex paraguariensis]|uniref:Uncharacterized protein n=1 Tax=Ilex paraguariensis TaxID=185542 RepID=A0ABC8UPU1_9AQUA
MTEENSSIINTVSTIVATTNDNKNPINDGEKKKKKKKRGTFNLLKAALFMFRHGTTRKKNSVQVEVASNGNWKKIVGSMRPLHLHDNPSSPPPPPSITATTSPTAEQFEEVIPPDSPSVYSVSGDTVSQYASANNLQELDDDDEEDDPDQVFDTIGADEMIDTKAESFIAQFYQQMRIQNLDSVNRHNLMVAKGKREE